MLRFGALVIGLIAAAPAFAQEMNATEARRFVAGKLFTYTCFEGTKGAGRINHDGSVAGTIQFQGSGPVRYAVLPANTLRAKGEQFCASIKGLPFEPCFNLVKTSQESFRGSVNGMGFAACEFKRRGGRAEFANAVSRPYQAAAAAPAEQKPAEE
jgi:hypothetical protein